MSKLSIFKTVSSFFSSLGRKKSNPQSTTSVKKIPQLKSRIEQISEIEFSVLKAYNKMAWPNMLDAAPTRALEELYYPFDNAQKLNEEMIRYVGIYFPGLKKEKDKQRLVLSFESAFLEVKYNFAQKHKAESLQLNIAEILVQKYELLQNLCSFAETFSLQKRIKDGFLKYKNHVDERRANKNIVSPKKMFDTTKSTMLELIKQLENMISRDDRGQMLTGKNALNLYKSLVEQYKKYAATVEEKISLNESQQYTAANKTALSDLKKSITEDKKFLDDLKQSVFKITDAVIAQNQKKMTEFQNNLAKSKLSGSYSSKHLQNDIEGLTQAEGVVIAASAVKNSM